MMFTSPNLQKDSRSVYVHGRGKRAESLTSIPNDGMKEGDKRE